jgi:acyl-coenzyme A thioesterase PaaI-like protein
MARDLDIEDLDRLAASVAELGSSLGNAPRRAPRGHDVGVFDPPGADGGPFGSFDSPLADRPVLGPTNPFAVESTSSIVGDEAVTTLTLGPGFEGAPGRAHGGIVAAIFDDVTGHVLRVVGTPAYTGSLTVRYHRPTPIDVPLEFRAWLERREGRRLHIEGACTADGARVASCDALFIAVDLERFAPEALTD